MQQNTFHSRKALLAGCLFLCMQVSVSAQNFADTARQIDQLFAKWQRNNGPGASIEIRRNGQRIYRWYGGMADLEHGVAVDSNSIFEAGSVSKQFTAAAILLLAEQGAISLQDDIRRYFPELPVYSRPIRVYHLLHHTSGLRDWGSVASVEGWGRGSRAHTNEDVLAIISRQRALNNVPGAEYIYSNSNFNLMALLVERVTKISFASFCQQQIFSKAGMPLTRWRNHYRAVVPNRTIGYAANFPLGWQMDMPFEDAHGNGGLLTNPAELAQWAWLTGTGQFRGLGFRNQQWEKGRLNNGREITYAAGLVVTDYRGHSLVTHSGSTAGYRANLDYYPEEGLVIAIQSNDASFQPVVMARAVADLLLTNQAPAFSWPVTKYAASANVLSALSGWYRNTRSNETMQVLYVQDSLRTKNGAGWLPLAEKSFLVNNQKAQFIVKGKDTILYIADRPDMSDTIYWKKDKPAVKSNASLAAYTGTYFSEEANAQLVISLKNDSLFCKQSRVPALYMTPTCLHGFTLPGTDIYFVIDGKKKPNGFLLSVNRARNIWFRKIMP